MFYNFYLEASFMQLVGYFVLHSETVDVSSSFV